MKPNLAAAVERVRKDVSDARNADVATHTTFASTDDLEAILAELGRGAGHSVLGIRVPKNRTDAELHYVEELGEDGKPTGYIWHPFRELENSLRKPVQDEDGYFPDELHIAAADAIANLRTALVSQIEITNTERAAAERMAKLYTESGVVAGEVEFIAHKFWGAGEADCPKDIKSSNGELHTLRCKVCGKDNNKEPCKAAITVTDDMVDVAYEAYADMYDVEYTQGSHIDNRRACIRAALTAAIGRG